MTKVKATLTKVEKRITVKERKQEGILSYDVDNNYPARVRDIVSSSGMGKSCVHLYRKFIFGKGFGDIGFAKAKINRHGLTPDKLLLKLSNDLAYFGGFAIHVNFNALGEVSEVNYQPFSHVRRTSKDSEYPNMFAVYKNWGERNIKKADIIYINKWNPNPEVVLQEIEACGGIESYKGQVFYFSTEGDEYPVAMYDAVLEDMQTDSQSKTYKFRNVTTNFMASHMLIVDKMESADGEDGGSREKSELIQSLEEYQGADDAQKIIVVEKESVDQTFTLEKVEQQNGDRLFEWTETSTRDNIRQAFLIPAVLLMSTPGKLGTADEIIDATKFYNTVTDDERLKLEESFSNIFAVYEDQSLNKEEYFYIQPREPITKEDTQRKQQVMNIVTNTSLSPKQKMEFLVKMYNMTEDEAKKLIFAEDVITSTQTLAEKLQVGGTQSMIAILSNASLTSEQKKGTLKVLFGLSEDQITLIIPDAKPDETNNA